MARGLPQELEESTIVEDSPQELEESTLVEGSPQELEESTLVEGSPQQLEESTLVEGSPQELEESTLVEGSPQELEESSIVEGSFYSGIFHVLKFMLFSVNITVSYTSEQPEVLNTTNSTSIFHNLPLSMFHIGFHLCISAILVGICHYAIRIIMCNSGRRIHQKYHLSPRPRMKTRTPSHIGHHPQRTFPDIPLNCTNSLPHHHVSGRSIV